MHLQVVDGKHRHLGYKVWLENRGQRAFELAGDMPAAIERALRKRIDEDRERIEAEWTMFMMKHSWIALAVALPIVSVLAYPRTPNSFVRTLDLSALLPGLYNPAPYVKSVPRVEQKHVRLNFELTSVEVAIPFGKRISSDDFYLPEILWQG